MDIIDLCILNMNKYYCSLHFCGDLQEACDIWNRR